MGLGLCHGFSDILLLWRGVSPVEGPDRERDSLSWGWVLTLASPASCTPPHAKSFFFSTSALMLPCVPQGAVIADKVNWVGCQGSEPHFRGFPCSLWILFHFLTVQASRQSVDPSQETGESGPVRPLGLSLPRPALHRLPAVARMSGSPRLQPSPLSPAPGCAPQTWGWVRLLPGFLIATSLLYF